jgi:hypothetical protein
MLLNKEQIQKELRRAAAIKYYYKNRTSIISRNHIKINCPCGGSYTYQNRKRHLMTKIHTFYIKKINEIPKSLIIKFDG